MAGIKDKIQRIEHIVMAIESYFSNPKETIAQDIANIHFGKNILKEEDSRNLEIGLNSSLTYEYALGLGRRYLVNGLTSAIEDVVDSFILQYKEMTNRCKVLKDNTKTLDEYFHTGIIESRWISINGSDMYKKYFLERLDREFLPMMNGSRLHIEFKLTIEKLILIYRAYLNNILEDKCISGLSKVADESNKILELIEDLDNLKIIIDKDKLEQFIPTEHEDIKVPIVTRDSLGKVLNQIALNHKDLLDNNRVDPLPGLEYTFELINKAYTKVTTDIDQLDNIVNGNKIAFIENMLPKIKDKLIEHASNYIEVKSTNQEFQSKMYTYINLLFRVMSIGDTINNITYEISSNEAEKMSIFLALFHLYYELMMYSVDGMNSDKVKVK